MKRLFIALFATLLAGSSVFAVTISRETPDVQSLTKYYESGQYFSDLRAVVREGQAYLVRKDKTKRPDEKLAIVFDIDETVLSNYPNMKRLEFTTNPEAIAAAYCQAKDPALKPVQGLYDTAIRKNITVFFVTGRPDSEEVRLATERNLREAGYEGFEALYLRPLNDADRTVVEFKSSVRKLIGDQGYTVILNVGDQQSDLDGGFAEKPLKLPNPFYTLS